MFYINMRKNYITCIHTIINSLLLHKNVQDYKINSTICPFVIILFISFNIWLIQTGASGQNKCSVREPESNSPCVHTPLIFCRFITSVTSLTATKLTCPAANAGHFPSVFPPSLFTFFFICLTWKEKAQVTEVMLRSRHSGCHRGTQTDDCRFVGASFGNTNPQQGSRVHE